MISYNRPFKNEVRRRVMRGLGKRESLLTLPSIEALCVKELLLQRSITQQTRQLWIERKGRLRQALEQQCARLRLTNTEITIVELERCQLTRSFDLVNLDLQSPMSLELASWVETTLAPKLSPQAALLVWLVRNWRSSNFMAWATKYFYYGPLAPQVNAFKSAVGTFDPCIVVPRLLIACALRDFDIEWVSSIEYADHHHAMLAIRVDNISRHRRRPIWPSITELQHSFHTGYEVTPRSWSARPETVKLHQTLEGMGLMAEFEFDSWVVRVCSTGKVVREFTNLAQLYDTFIGGTTMTKLTPGKKAAATRRANKEADKWRQAGLKSWETRRRNETERATAAAEARITRTGRNRSR